MTSQSNSLDTNLPSVYRSTLAKWTKHTHLTLCSRRSVECFCLPECFPSALYYFFGIAMLSSDLCQSFSESRCVFALHCTSYVICIFPWISAYCFAAKTIWKMNNCLPSIFFDGIELFRFNLLHANINLNTYWSLDVTGSTFFFFFFKYFWRKG